VPAVSVAYEVRDGVPGVWLVGQNAYALDCIVGELPGKLVFPRAKILPDAPVVNEGKKPDSKAETLDLGCSIFHTIQFSDGVYEWGKFFLARV